MHQRLLLSSNKNILYISKSEISENFQTNFHSHPNLEMLFFLEGTGFIQTSVEQIPVEKNSVAIINAQTTHCEIGNGLIFYAIGINKLNIFLKNQLAKKIIYLKASNNNISVIELTQMIYDEAIQKNSNYHLMIDNYLQNIMILISRKIDSINYETKNTLDSDLVFNLKNYIDNCFTNELHLDEIATRFSQSKSTICHAFKQQTGMTIMTYKINKQLEESTNLLQITDMDISQIANLVGFNDSSYFTKLFKRKYGVTPKAYKKQS